MGVYTENPAILFHNSITPVFTGQKLAFTEQKFAFSMHKQDRHISAVAVHTIIMEKPTLRKYICHTTGKITYLIKCL